MANVIALMISPSAGEPMLTKEMVKAVENKGLVDDRYYLGLGYYTGDKVWDANVTLIEQEAHDAANGDGKTRGKDAVGPECLRRNIVTKGVDLKTLIGCRFQIGEVILMGTKEWPACTYIDSLNPGRNVLKKFAKTAGIGATVVQGGIIRVGDQLQILEASAS